MRTVEFPRPQGIAPSSEREADVFAKIEVAKEDIMPIQLFSATKKSGKFANGDLDLEFVRRVIESHGALQVGSPVIVSDFGCREGCSKTLTVLRSPSGVDFRTETIVTCKREESISIWVTKTPPELPLLSRLASRVFGT